MEARDVYELLIKETDRTISHSTVEMCRPHQRETELALIVPINCKLNIVSLFFHTQSQLIALQSC